MATVQTLVALVVIVVVAFWVGYQLGRSKGTAWWLQKIYKIDSNFWTMRHKRDRWLRVSTEQARIIERLAHRLHVNRELNKAMVKEARAKAATQETSVKLDPGQLVAKIPKIPWMTE